MLTRLFVFASLALPWFASAWIMPHRQTTMMRPLQASVEKTQAKVATTTEDIALQPEFEGAFQMICAKVQGSLPEKYVDSMFPLLEHFAKEYVSACQTSLMTVGEEMEELCRPDMVAKRFLTGIQLAMTYGMGPNKFQFKPFHKMCVGEDPENEGGNTMNLYEVGNQFFRPCINMEKSVLTGQDNIEKIISQVKQGHNVVMFANHQSEADPQVVSCMMDELTEYGEEFKNMIFVAGHKVTTDPLAVPFSMGRNLICIHSKKHIDADPETKASKQKENLRAMSGMLTAFKSGGTLLWVAPSGGRDRRDLETGDVPIAPFDSKTIDMFRLIGNKSKVPTHYYTMGMVTYDMCPPPDFVEAGVGEKRNIRFTPCGIAVGDECDSVGGLESRRPFRDHAFNQCNEDYEALVKALES